MKTINQINITETSYQIFENIIGCKRKENKEILLSINNEIEILYQIYERNCTDLFNLIPKGYQDAEKDALIHCFESETEITKDLKKQIKSIENRKCPYCYIEYSSQVEHYLPKDEFPEFSFMIHNLFPTCGTCNSKKGELRKDTVSRTILNFYYDSIPTEQFLYANLNIIDGIILPQFFINTDSIAIDPNIKQILQKHIERLSLLDRYSESINDKLSELRNRIKISGSLLEKDVIKIECKKEAETQRATYGNNYYVSVLYAEIANNDEVIDFLFNL